MQTRSVVCPMCSIASFDHRDRRAPCYRWQVGAFCDPRSVPISCTAKGRSGRYVWTAMQQILGGCDPSRVMRSRSMRGERLTFAKAL